jgi:hypothetical protein
MLSLNHHLQNDCGHFFYATDILRSSPGVKQPERKANHLRVMTLPGLILSTEVMMSKLSVSRVVSPQSCELCWLANAPEKRSDVRAGPGNILALIKPLQITDVADLCVLPTATWHPSQ